MRHGASRRIFKITFPILTIFSIIGLAIALSSDVEALISKSYDQVSGAMILHEIIWQEAGSTNLSSQVTPRLLEQASGLKAGQEILKTDLLVVENKLRSVPWIESVEIQKRLPSTIAIKFSIYQARAITVRRGKPWLVSGDGHYIAELARVTHLTPQNIQSQQEQPFLAIGPLAGSAGGASGGSLDSSISGSNGIQAHSNGNSSLNNLPVLMTDTTLFDQLRWLDSLERDLSPLLLEVHEVYLDRYGVLTAIIDVNYRQYSAKTSITAFSKVSALSMVRLRRVLRYLVENGIVGTSIDLRPGKKVVVNVAKNS